MATAEETEVARPEKGDHFVLHRQVVERRGDGEAGEAERNRQLLRNLRLAVLEQRHVERQGDRGAVADDMDRHRLVVQKAEMEQMQAIIRAAVLPERLLPAEPDLAIAVIGERFQRVGNGGCARVERAGRKVPGLADDILVTETATPRLGGWRGGRPATVLGVEWRGKPDRAHGRQYRAAR